MTETLLIATIALMLGAVITARAFRARSSRKAEGLSQAELDKLDGPLLLAADASFTTLKVIELSFLDTEFTVVTARDGAAALELLERKRFDALLVDVDLPGKNGREICEYAKVHYREMPVVLLVGAFANPKKKVRAGADALLIKPFDSSDLTELIKKLTST